MIDDKIRKEPQKEELIIEEIKENTNDFSKPYSKRTETNAEKEERKILRMKNYGHNRKLLDEAKIAQY